MLIKSYSKVNLFLIVSNKKYKDLHKIKSLFLLNRDIYDEIEINKSDSLKINYFKENKKISINNCNVNRILLFIKEKYYIDINFDIRINKKIPIGSGIGGSSSNAAYVAKYILDLNNIDYKNDYESFIEIGSDIPFFLSGFECAYVSEYGNKIIKKKKPKISYEIIFNDIEISTKDVYDNFYNNKNPNIFRNYFFQMFFIKIKKYNLLINDLQESCFSLNYDFKKKFMKEKNDNKFTFLIGSGSSFIRLVK
ncbi:MAG: hypothetical protein ACRDCF_03300 [Mycoplasmoidaceae bacterium]